MREGSLFIEDGIDEKSKIANELKIINKSIKLIKK